MGIVFHERHKNTQKTRRHQVERFMTKKVIAIAVCEVLSSFAALLSYSMNRRNNLCNASECKSTHIRKNGKKKENKTTFVSNVVVNSLMSMHPSEARASNVTA